MASYSGLDEVLAAVRGLSYETGTWTPVLTTTGTDFDSVTPFEPDGQYTKIGALVTVFCNISTDAVTKGSASGNVVISGLPYPASADVYLDATGVGFASDWLVNNPAFCGINPNESQVRLWEVSAGSPIGVADVDTGSSKNYLTFTLTYRTNP